MKRTTVLKSAAVLGAATLALAACSSSSSSSSSSAAPADASAAASEAPASAPAAGVPLYLVDGNTGNALGEKLPAGTLNGVKGTIPGAEQTQDFRDSMKALDPELIDYSYGPEAYDAVIVAALAAAQAKSDAGVDMAKQLVAITNGPDNCTSYKECLDMIAAGKKIHYNGKSGLIQFWDAGDPTSATIGVYQFGPDNKLVDTVQFNKGTITPEGEANAIDGKPQKGANDGVFTVGTLLPVTGSLAFLGPPEVDAVKLAINDINAAGGVPGFKKVVLEEGDSGDSSTNTATQTVNRLLPKNVDVLIGAASSSVTLNVLDLVTSNGVLMISPANTSPALTTAKDHGLYWRTAPSDVLQGQFLGTLILQDGHSKVAIMSLQDAYGDGLNANVTKAITDGGGQVVANVVYDPKATDFSADVAKVKAAGPDAIVLIGFDESAQVIQELVKQGIGPNAAG
ncbi:MAG: ABC transporter substrate-binding protein [Actinomycetes bacterium]|jgi:ABC-type branched-subunit amino acid transport system substrate-binding protein